MKKLFVSILAVACIFTSCLSFNSSKFNKNVEPEADNYQYALHVDIVLDDDAETEAAIQKSIDNAFSNTRLKIVNDADSLSAEQQDKLLNYEYTINYDSNETNINFTLSDYNTGKVIASFVGHDFNTNGQSSLENSINWLCEAIQDSFQ